MFIIHASNSGFTWTRVVLGILGLTQATDMKVVKYELGEISSSSWYLWYIVYPRIPKDSGPIIQLFMTRLSYLMSQILGEHLLYDQIISHYKWEIYVLNVINM